MVLERRDACLVRVTVLAVVGLVVALLLPSAAGQQRPARRRSGGFAAGGLFGFPPRVPPVADPLTR
ncbi:hypothetical protein [Streptomyces sp. AS02]|uniref:hypothetical protein n=1 Tax=Streptomyces sp. AS02 TaxID=2938946 RepID=UPI002021ECCB|nr:hypothetical protein [Streptomyces sp. AS02]MCL8011069.1 hypothetical protein [Streptomyces sp. AS02]